MRSRMDHGVEQYSPAGADAGVGMKAEAETMASAAGPCLQARSSQRILHSQCMAAEVQ